MSESKVIFEPHPVTPERKAELRAQGLRIFDAIFKPAGDDTAPAEADPAEKPAVRLGRPPKAK